jgi:hypothetical protein
MCSLSLHNTPGSTPSSTELAGESGDALQGDMALLEPHHIDQRERNILQCMSEVAPLFDAEFTSALWLVPL